MTFSKHALNLRAIAHVLSSAHEQRSDQPAISGREWRSTHAVGVDDLAILQAVRDDLGCLVSSRLNRVVPPRWCASPESLDVAMAVLRPQ
jgi:hypothetical protein